MEGRRTPRISRGLNGTSYSQQTLAQQLNGTAGRRGATPDSVARFTSASVAPTSMFGWGFENTPSELAYAESEKLRRTLSAVIRPAKRPQGKKDDLAPTREMLRWAQTKSMYKIEKELSQATAYTLHKLLVASHAPDFDPDTTDPKLVHTPMPPSASLRYLDASGRTMRQPESPVVVDAQPLFRPMQLRRCV